MNLFWVIRDIIFNIEMKDYLGLLLQLRYPNDAGGAQWLGFASSEIAHVKNQGFYSVVDCWSLLYSIETGAAPVMCPCNHFIFRYLRLYRALFNQALFFDVWYLISIWIELLFVSDRLDKLPGFRLKFSQHFNDLQITSAIPWHSNRILMCYPKGQKSRYNQTFYTRCPSILYF